MTKKALKEITAKEVFTLLVEAEKRWHILQPQPAIEHFNSIMELSKTPWISTFGVELHRGEICVLILVRGMTKIVQQVAFKDSNGRYYIRTWYDHRMVDLLI
ncbi:hypothetical protein HYV31_04245 [candidate division WWE3 bacterium]|nr:hypothetical protein [candidate division WWE3 bacterium]